MHQLLFVAAYPPLVVAEAALASLRRLDLPDYRETRPESVHLTLQFIGDVTPRNLAAVTESVARSASGIGSFELSPERLVTLPSRADARLVALETDKPSGVMELHRRLATGLAQSLRREPSDRFLPHMTLCRFRHPEKGLRIDEPVQLDKFTVSQIKLMRSVQQPGGVEHHQVGVFALE